MSNHIHMIIKITNPVGDDLRVVPNQNQESNQIINKNDLTDDGQEYNNGRIRNNGQTQRSVPTGQLSL